MQRNEVLRVMYDLPQVDFLNDEKIERFLNKLDYLKEDAGWHAQRMAGFGGSEVGALLRERHGAFTAAPGDSFKTADQVIAEKLLHRLPMSSTIQAKRGTSIEALTQAAFIKKSRAKPFDEAVEASKAHHTISSMRGNIDDALIIGRKTALVDYKSSQRPYEQVPFDYLTQCNHYGAIAKSNGIEFDKGIIVGIHAPEAMLQGLAAISDSRHEDRETFDFWADLIAKDKVPSVTLKIYHSPLNDKLMSLCEAVVESRWEDFVLKGKLLIPDQSVELSEDNLRLAEKLMQDATQMIAIQKITNQRLDEKNAHIDRLMQGVNTKKLPFMKNHPINISSRASLDKEAALAALESEGVEVQDISVMGKNYDVDLLINALRTFQPDLDMDAYKAQEVSVPSIRGALKSAGLDDKLFESTKHSFTPSKAKAKASAFDEVVSQHEEIFTMT